MREEKSRNLGAQPLALLMQIENLSPSDLVSDQEMQLNYKMISRAIKGRRLTLHMQNKILIAFNRVASKGYLLQDLFNY